MSDREAYLERVRQSRGGLLVCFRCGWTMYDCPSGRGALLIHLREEHNLSEEDLPDFGDEPVIGGKGR